MNLDASPSQKNPLTGKGKNYLYIPVVLFIGRSLNDKRIITDKHEKILILTLYALKSFYDNNVITDYYLKEKTIAQFMGISKTTLRGRVKELRKRKLLESIGGRSGRVSLRLVSTEKIMAKYGFSLKKDVSPGKSIWHTKKLKINSNLLIDEAFIGLQTYIINHHIQAEKNQTQKYCIMRYKSRNEESDVLIPLRKSKLMDEQCCLQMKIDKNPDAYKFNTKPCKSRKRLSTIMGFKSASTSARYIKWGVTNNLITDEENIHVIGEKRYITFKTIYKAKNKNFLYRSGKLCFRMSNVVDVKVSNLEKFLRPSNTLSNTYPSCYPLLNKEVISN